MWINLKEIEDLGLLPPEAVEVIRWKIGMGSRVCLAARAMNASAIFVSVTTGETAKYVSYFRPVQQIISIGSSMVTARRLLLWKGIYPVVMQYYSEHEVNDFILAAREIHSIIHIMPTKEWKDKEEFIIPGLLRIESKLQDGNDKKLRKYLEDKLKVKHIEQIKQRNHYFYDKSGVIMDNQAMVRIRIEKVDQKSEQAVLTIKRKGKKVYDGTVERWEKEFNVTPYFFSNGPRNHMGVSFGRLPDFFRELLWNEFQEDFEKRDIKSPGDIEFVNVASMVNNRLTVETHSELILELDASSTREDCKYYELEIETIAADEDRRDEYIELLFGYLGIPAVCHQDYPTKFVRTLLDFGLLAMNDKFRSAIESVHRRLDISPRM